MHAITGRSTGMTHDVHYRVSVRVRWISATTELVSRLNLQTLRERGTTSKATVVSKICIAP